MDTFLEFIGSTERSKCGYCKNEQGEKKEEALKKEGDSNTGTTSEGSDAPAEEAEETRNSSVTTGGAWAHQMLTKDYAALLDMGWRRSGRYLYKPHNEVTCCPQYTIRLDVTRFKMSRTQKRVMRQMNEFLATGKRPVCSESVDDKPEVSKKKEQSSANRPTESCSSSLEPAIKKVKDADRPVLKKKEIRNAKFEEKCRKRNLDPEVIREQRRQKEAARQRTIQSYIDEAKPEWKHKLEVKLVTSGTEEFSARDNESFELYKKYQSTVHNDECRLIGFRRFLCDSPLKKETNNGVELGSFHMWFLLDEKLIAVCVVDVLPKCISAKYMYYDPDYSFLSMGTYTALREIHQTMQLNRISADLKYYYMGYYIHSCPKMRYKAKFHPSDLLCEQSFKWLEFDACRPLLDASTAPNGYAPFRPDCDRPAAMPVGDLMVLSNGLVTRLERALSRIPEAAEDEELKEKTRKIVNLIGPDMRSAVFYFEELNPNQ